MIAFIRTLFKKKEKSPQLSMGEAFTFDSDSAAVAIYDPQLLQERLEEDLDWFIESHACKLAEVQKGDCAVIGLGSQGNYKIRLKNTELTEEEKAFAKYSAYMGLKVIKGKCFVGDKQHGRLLALPNGNYDLLIYGLDYAFLDKVDGNACDLTTDALKERLADMVIIIQPRTDDFVAPLEENAMFADSSRHYLFHSLLRNEMIAKHLLHKK